MKDAAGAAWIFVEAQAIGRLGDVVRDMVGKLLHTDQQVDALKQPSDTFVADLGIEGTSSGRPAPTLGDEVELSAEVNTFQGRWWPPRGTR